MNKNRANELKINTIIIAVANLGSKAIAFILAPLYSYYLSTSQYGKMDLITTTVSLMGPILCLDIFEATFRFSSEKGYQREKTISTSLIVTIPGLLLLLSISLGTLYMSESPDVIIYTCAFVYLDAINHILSQFLRGENRMKLFAVSGVVNSVFLLLSNLIFLVFLKWELSGWMISFLVGKLGMMVFCLCSVQLHKIFSFRFFDLAYLRTFFQYCIPLLPTALMWWVMNVSDRYMLAFFAGTSITGIYAVANKVPSLLSIFENVFYQAFQVSGINDLDNKNRDSFYSDVFNGYLAVLSIGIAGLLIIIKPIILTVFASDYSSAWIPTPILLVSVLVHALAGNLGTYYVVFKKTRGALITSAVGAVVNITLNAFCIPLYGAAGAAIATMIGYMCTLLFRWKDTRKFVNLSLNRKNVLFYTVVIILQITLYYIPGYLSYIIRVFIMCVVLYKERKMLIRFIR